ncbi:MAG: cytochrome c biogenesis protein CcdA [Proteobacteria bacterium]|jgi:cytochrome c-type biogenesis protein|nr:cytochrome c biogenesis protein CcdA [Pseudomonadota bacterium]
MIFTGLISFIDFTSIVAFSTGMLSFFSPCILPLVPSYLIFISGITFDNYNELEFKKYRKIVLIHSISFIFGFSVVFVSLGISSSLIGKFLSTYQTYIMRFGGLILILMGLYYLNIIRIPMLNHEKIIHLKEKPVGLLGSFIVGITFSVGWTPCVGPALSSILIIASTTQNILEGIYLLSLYSLGLAIPFIISALIFDRLFTLLKKFSHIVRYSMKVMGILLIIIGVLLFSSYYSTLSLRLGQLIAF